MIETPPKWALKFLRWYCKPRLLEFIEGDIIELFEDRARDHTLKKAKLLFVWDVIRFLRIRYIKGLDEMEKLNSLALFRNYFKVSIRNLINQRFYSIVNISGLSIGLTCVMLIFLFIRNEFGYDKFYPDHEQIYRVALNQKGTQTPSKLASTFKSEYPEVEAAARLNGEYTATFVRGGNIIKQSGGYLADSTLFNIFAIEFISGDPQRALTEVNSLVLSEEIALKFFGSVDVLDQLIKVDGTELKVTGVVQNSKDNTHFPYKYFASMPRDKWVTDGYWTGNNFYTYLKLNSEADVAALEAKFPDFVKKYIGPEIISFTGHSSFEEYVAATGRNDSFTLIPIADIHLKHPRFSMGSPGDIENIYIFSIVAAFILLLAGINFMNLSTARSAVRSKEVGIRKVMGSPKTYLVTQFLVESIIISLVSLFFAFTLASLVMPAFSLLSGRVFAATDLFTVQNITYSLGIIIIVGILAGSYPAFFISSFKPIVALKGKASTGSSGVALRKGLVVFQFAVSLILIVSTFIVFSQLQFMSSQKLGLNASQSLVVKNGATLESPQTFINALRANPNIKNVAASNHYPSGNFSNWNYSTIDENSLSYSPMHLFADENFVETLGINMVAGEYFTGEKQSDSTSIVINQAFAKKLPWADPIGKELTRGDNSRFQIIGIVSDFNYNSLKQSIQPLLIRFQNKGYGDFGGPYYTVNVSGNIKNTVEFIQATWKAHSPEEPFDYIFLDESFNRLYDSDRRFAQIFTIFSVLAVIIACLGLFALAAFTLQKRIKEVVIRKVMGASVFELFKLLIQDFNKWVIAGVILGAPIAWYLMSMWLQDFSYAIQMNIYLFLLPILLLIGIAWLTISFQIFRVSRANPSEVLSEE